LITYKANLVDRTLFRIAYPVSKLSLVNTELITYKAKLVDRTLFRIAYPVSKLSLVNTELITYKANLVDRTLFRIAYPVSKLSLVNMDPAVTVNLYPQFVSSAGLFLVVNSYHSVSPIKQKINTMLKISMLLYCLRYY
jgi:hypothetical protein